MGYGGSPEEIVVVEARVRKRRTLELRKYCKKERVIVVPGYRRIAVSLAKVDQYWLESCTRAHFLASKVGFEKYRVMSMQPYCALIVSRYLLELIYENTGQFGLNDTVRVLRC